jgi:hypothetical protein
MWTSLVKAAFGLTVAAQMVSSRIIVSRQEQCASATNDAEKGACDMKAAFGGSAIFAQVSLFIPNMPLNRGDGS